MIETERLVLRRWREPDRDAWARIAAESAVMAWLGRGPMTRAESDAFIDRAERSFDEHGYGVFAATRKGQGDLIGYVGLSRIDHAPPVPQGVEFAWGLASGAWGMGYATEAAAAVMRHGFEALGLRRIIAYTAAENRRSQAVMRRLGMVRREDLDFEHPRLPEGHALRRHVVFLATPPPGQGASRFGLGDNADGHTRP